MYRTTRFVASLGNEVGGMGGDACIHLHTCDCRGGVFSGVRGKGWEGEQVG